MRRLLFLVGLFLIGAPASAGPRGEGKAGPAAVGKAGAGLPGGGPGRMRPGIRRGNAMLNSGLPMAAAGAFRDAVLRDPDNAEAHVGLGQARARAGRCGGALEHLLPWTHALAFGPKVAMLTANCLERQGYPQEAVAMDLHALRLRPGMPGALTRLALDADRVGDDVLRQAAIEQLWVADPRRDESIFAEAALALRHGDVDLLDVMARLWAREGRDNDEFDRLDVRAWLDLDDPGTALEVFAKHRRVRRGAAARLLAIEGSRRLGLTSQARASIEAKAFGVLAGSDADVIRIRLSVDEGLLDEAQRLADTLAGERDEELIGSRWYLARARGDRAQLAGLVAEYEAIRTSPLRTLEQLVPIDRR
ncbi:MAG: hypothetical protein EXR71_13830 [Myxococcales bacterium]|nr:hypothetical protein [Myxococcales bacterium]